MTTAYHVTDRYRLSSIRRKGLQPHDTAKNNHPTYPPQNHGVKNVYMFRLLKDAKKFLGAVNQWGNGRKPCIIKLKLPGSIELLEDNVFWTIKSSVKSATAIPAKFITGVVK